MESLSFFQMHDLNLTVSSIIAWQRIEVALSLFKSNAKAPLSIKMIFSFSTSSPPTLRNTVGRAPGIFKRFYIIFTYPVLPTNLDC